MISQTKRDHTEATNEDPDQQSVQLFRFSWVLTLKKFFGMHHDLDNPHNVAVFTLISDVKQTVQTIKSRRLSPFLWTVTTIRP